MPVEKAPGPDGYIGCFFRASWETVKETVFAVFQKIYTLNALHLNKINIANIILLPKKDQAMEIAEFRPISLIHNIVKILSNMLSLRLSTYMDNLISISQSAFIKRRTIQDNFLYVQNIARSYHRSNTPMLMLKLDIAKAFDSISWPYLLDMLHCRGFGHRWRTWIAMLLGTSSSRIVLNGIQGPNIRHQCGVRQGDCLSPYLFILAIDVLQCILELAD